MSLHRFARILLLLLGSVAAPSWCRAGGMGISTEGDTVGLAATQVVTVPFHRYQVPALRSQYANRDIEFLWSDSYRQLGAPLVPPGSTEENDLDRFGKMLCEEPRNPFGFSTPDIRLVYDFFAVPIPGFRPLTYDPLIFNPGFRVRSTTDPALETDHVDTYLWLQGVDDAGLSGASLYSSYPSTFQVLAEDSVTSYPAVFPRNSIDIIGPTVAQVGDLNIATRWTRPDGRQNASFSHEFQHAVNNDGYSPPSPHMFASGAEAVTGIAKDPPLHDVPYMFNLIGEAGGSNYQAWLSFTAYVAFNYRGVDTTLAGLADDLVARWARSTNENGGRALSLLINHLAPANCAECETPARAYFAGLTPRERFHLLLHHWRVAQYVNNSNLAQGQYGYPPHLGFDPVRDVGNWRDVDTTPAAADSFNIPHEFTLSSAHVTREVGHRGPAAGTAPRHVPALQDFGADYWVIRSDPSLWSQGRDLVVRVSPEGGCAPRRLMLSLIAYTQENLPSGAPDSLWKHPEWAGAVFGPSTMDLAPLNPTQGVEVVLPNFGTTYKAVVAVVTLSQDADAGGFGIVLPYRLNAAIRTAPWLSPNPSLVQSETTHDDWPTWSPTGQELAFVRRQGTLSQIYIKGLNGAPATAMRPASAGQFRPDWSPRGDWIVFDQESSPDNCDIYVANPATQEFRQLTFNSLHEYEPAFSPNGQRIAYLRTSGQVTGQTVYDLSVVNLAGGGDSILVRRDCFSNCAVSSPKWSPDGLWIYYESQDSLYAVRVSGPQRGLVVPRSRLPMGTNHIHLPLGHQRILLEGFPSNDWPSGTCGGNQLLQDWAMLFDTTGTRAEMVFDRVGSYTRNPRWSFDGTRVAFSSDRDAPAGQADVFVGQVAFNHAPTFSAGLVVDSEVALGTPVGMWLTGSDPDGETVSFDAAYLPPGASLSSAGYFSWPFPEPLGAEYYVAFRALDSSGGVDNRVVKLTVGMGSGGCPYADTRTEAGWRTENSLLARSLTGDLTIDAYRLKAAPANLGGRYHVRLRENEQEYATLDQVRLVAVDHPPGYETFALGQSLELGSRVAAARVTTQRGEDITPLVNGLGPGFTGQPGDILTVEWATSSSSLAGVGAFGSESVQDCECPPGVVECGEKEQLATWGGAGELSARPTGVALDQAVLNETGILIQRPDGQGGWRTVRHHYPREVPDGAAFDSLGREVMRLVFVGRHKVSFIGRLAPAPVAPAISALNLMAARHTRLGNVKSAVANGGGQSVSLVPGDTLNLEFAVSTPAAGQVREWFLVSTGVYSSSATPTQLQEAALRLPLRFALGRNLPNPFRHTTTIQYELPAPARGRLEVFDAQGRRVRVLVEGELPPGYHSAEWDRRDATGVRVRPGVYLYRFSAGSFRDQRKMIVLE